MEAFPGTFSSSVKALHTGNPIRESISAVPVPELRFKDREGALRLLVVGGSLGAQSFNELLPVALSTLPEAERPEVWHQAGKRHHDKAQACYREHRVDARVDAFIADMNEAYAWADLVVCRSGALTVSELSAVGVASILVPFPYAVDDHQTANAAFLADHQAAILVQQRDLDAPRLATLLMELNHRERLLEMAKAARAQAKLDASQLVAQNCQEAACG
jgi:UDP-N-acetylglucosamine--N-acetylmuramyl-(pentapeptide) pyrophosphoryl-undecaprenol N-acetylglucosamine transferase